MEFFGSIILGFETALTPTNILYCFVGVFLGTFIGVIPGIGAMSAIALLFPLTFYLDPTTGLIMLAGIYYGTGYGGRIASILLNVPGDAACAVTCFDGYPMAQQGRGSVALLLTAVSSFIGGSIGIIAMMFVAPLIARFALSFGPADYFSMMLFGLVATAVVSDQDMAKGLGSMFLGILLGIVGVDALTGVPRLTFGSFALYDGLSLVALAMGIFGVTEVIFSVRRTPSGSGSGKGGDNLGSMRPTKDDLSRTWKPALRGSAIGSFLGALPGTGPTIASFMSYSVEKRAPIWSSMWSLTFSSTAGSTSESLRDNAHSASRLAEGSSGTSRMSSFIACCIFCPPIVDGFMFFPLPAGFVRLPIAFRID